MELRIMSFTNLPIETSKELLDKLETEVMETIDNPYSTYQVKLPYTCSFTIPDDDNNTEVIISTKSCMIRYGRSEHDIEFQLELDKEHSKPTYAKHILNWISTQLHYIDPKTVDVEYGSSLDITPMTNKEINDYRNDCLSDD